MDMESIGAYSPTTVYGQLSSPFIPKNITLNAHTPYDKEEDAEAVSLGNYLESRPNIKLVSGAMPKEITGVGYTKNGYKLQTDDKQDEDKFPPEPGVSGFSASKLSSKDIVSGAIKKGYTAEQAATITKAKKAYENSYLSTRNPIKTLSTRSYVVS